VVAGRRGHGSRLQRSRTLHAKRSRPRRLGGKGERFPSEQELAMARYQGRHAAQIATKLFG
jgi:hypothetical protein